MPLLAQDTAQRGFQLLASHGLVQRLVDQELKMLSQHAIISRMNNKHRSTLDAVFATPVNGNLVWSRIEALLVAAGCTVIEGNGSSVTFEHQGRRAYFHRPHPNREALRYRVLAAREFLQQIGVKP